MLANLTGVLLFLLHALVLSFIILITAPSIQWRRDRMSWVRMVRRSGHAHPTPADYATVLMALHLSGGTGEGYS